MKIPRTFILIGLFVSGWATAQQPALNPSATTRSESELRVIRKFDIENKSDTTVRRIGKLSTRAWTTAVGWHPGESAFPDPKTAEVGLYLISLGNKPQQQVEKFYAANR